MFTGKSTGSSSEEDDVNISPIQSFMIGFASRVGTGNIAGVAAAVIYGGPGAVFWMWLAALIGMGSAFAESSLAQLYKTKNREGYFVGGPAFYIAQGMKLPWVGILFSVLLIFTYGFAFNSIQSYQIAATLKAAFDVNTNYTAIAVGLITLVAILGSLSFISRISSALVVTMSVSYIAIGIITLAINYDAILPAFGLIFKSAFNFDSALGATIGIAISYGIKRGLYSNEAGMGSAPNIAATASTKHPAEQGFVQMLGVFFDTIIICTFTALVIITVQLATGDQYQSLFGNYKGADLTVQSISHTFGSISASFSHYASIIMTVIVFLLAFTSIVGNYAYSLSGLKYITQSKAVRFVYALLVVAMVYYGSIASADQVWDLGDFAMGLMTLLNCIAILFLSRQIYLIIHDYARQKANGVEEPVFNSDLYPELREKFYHQSIWSRHRDEDYDQEIHK